MHMCTDRPWIFFFPLQVFNTLIRPAHGSRKEMFSLVGNQDCFLSPLRASLSGPLRPTQRGRGASHLGEGVCSLKQAAGFRVMGPRGHRLAGSGRDTRRRALRSSGDTLANPCENSHRDHYQSGADGCSLKYFCLCALLSPPPTPHPSLSLLVPRRQTWSPVAPVPDFCRENTECRG